MEIITDLNELPRGEMMKKSNESFQKRIAQLQASVEVKEKKVVELTEKYTNEINMRKNAEAIVVDANSKIEELQNALDSFQQRAYDLEREMETYQIAIRDLQSSQTPIGEEMLEQGVEAQHEQALQMSHSSLAEEIFEALVDTEGEEANREELLEQMNKAIQERARAMSFYNDLDNSRQKLDDLPIERRLESISEKLDKERLHTIMLEDKLAAIEESFQEVEEIKDTVIRNAESQEEWLKSLLAKEREQNEKLSQESDRTIEELQEKLKDANDLNSQLLKWKDEVFNSANFREETEAKYKEIIAQYEIELEEARNGLADIRAELLALRSEQTRTLEEELEDEILTSTPKKHKQAALDSEASSSDEFQEEQEQEGEEEDGDGEEGGGGAKEEEEEEKQKEETPVMAVESGNQRYRIKLAQLIWNGMQHLLNL